jgi:hypothetical protein
MIFVSLTRLRIRSIRFVPLFALHAFRSIQQVKMAPGFQGGAVLPDRDWAYWTMTAWDSQENMRRFMATGSHKAAMPHLLFWCDEASVAHWEQAETSLPSWPEVDKRMREEGRVSKVLNPSPQHASLSYKVPRGTGSVTIRGRGNSA